jgi:hypothetical protein
MPRLRARDVVRGAAGRARLRAVAGYSGTPLAKKLGIGPDCRIHVANAPGDYFDLVAPLPKGVKVVPRISSDIDIVHLFSTSRSDLAAKLRATLARLKPDATIWVSWPKKSSKVPTDISEDTIRELALPLGLVDIKVCAVDDVWSGLKLVIRKTNRSRAQGSRRKV